MFLVSSSIALAQPIEGRYKFKNKDVIGAAPTGDVPTTPELSTIVLPIKVWLIWEVWR